MTDVKNDDRIPEIVDAELDTVSGGQVPPGWTSRSHKCPTPGCNVMLPWNYQGICDECKAKNMQYERR